jgi:nucleotide-binding universal stress UspA family protein
MTPIATILVATDFRPTGSNAVWRAALLARQLDARLRLMHVVHTAGFKPLRHWLLRPIDIDLEAAQARATLRQLSAEIAGRHDVTAAVEVHVGDPHEELLRASAQADLLVLGQRGRKPWKSLVIGGTADRMLHSSRTPVLVVKGKADGVPARARAGGPDAAFRCRGAGGASLAPSAAVGVFRAIESARRCARPAWRTILREAGARHEARISAHAPQRSASGPRWLARELLAHVRLRCRPRCGCCARRRRPRDHQPRQCIGRHPVLGGQCEPPSAHASRLRHVDRAARRARAQPSPRSPFARAARPLVAPRKGYWTSGFTPWSESCWRTRCGAARRLLRARMPRARASAQRRRVSGVLGARFVGVVGAAAAAP